MTETPAPVAARRRAPVGTAVAAVVVSALSALPLGYLVVRATERGWTGFSATFWRSRTAEMALHSVLLAGGVTAASLAIGVAFAWLVVHTDLPGRPVLRVLLALPLALPSYVAAFGWLGVAPGMVGGWGAFVVLTTISYPYVYLPVAAGLARCDPALTDVARTCGLGRFVTFWRVVLPQVRLPVVGGGLLVALYVLSEFGAVSLMRHEVLTTMIYRSYRGSFDRTPAAVLGCVLAALALVVVALERRAARRRGTGTSMSRTQRPQPVHRLGRWRWPSLLVVLGWLALALGVPAAGLYEWFGRGGARPDGARFVTASANTLQVGLLGAAAVVCLAFPLAVLSVRHPGRLARSCTSVVYAAHALPGVVVGLSLVFFGVAIARPIYQELPLLVLGYVVLYLSLALGSLQGAISQIPVGLTGVARSLGHSRTMAFWRVTVRLSAPGVAAAATLVFLTIMKELPTTLFLRPTGFDTLATQLWSHSTSFSKSAAAPYAAAIVVFAALPTALLASLGRDRPRRGPIVGASEGVDR